MKVLNYRPLQPSSQALSLLWQKQLKVSLTEGTIQVMDIADTAVIGRYPESATTAELLLHTVSLLG